MSGQLGDTDGPSAKWSVSSGKQQKKRHRGPSSSESRPPKRSSTKTPLFSTTTTSTTITTDRAAGHRQTEPGFRTTSPAPGSHATEPRFRNNHQPAPGPAHRSEQGAATIEPDAGDDDGGSCSGRWGPLHKVSSGTITLADAKPKRRSLSEASPSSQDGIFTFSRPAPPRQQSTNHGVSTTAAGGGAAGNVVENNAGAGGASLLPDLSLTTGTTSTRTRAKPRLGERRHGSAHEQTRGVPISVPGYAGQQYHAAPFNSPSTFESRLPATAPPPASCLTAVSLSSPSLSDTGLVFSPTSAGTHQGPLPPADPATSSSQDASIASAAGIYTPGTGPASGLGVLADSPGSAHLSMTFLSPSHPHPVPDPFGSYQYDVPQPAGQVIDNSSRTNQVHSQPLHLSTYPYYPGNFSLYDQMRYSMLDSDPAQGLTFDSAHMSPPGPVAGEYQQHAHADLHTEISQAPSQEDDVSMKQSPPQIDDPFMVVVRSPGGPVAVPEANPLSNDASGSSEEDIVEGIKEEIDGKAEYEADETTDDNPERGGRSDGMGQKKTLRKRFSQDERKATAETRKQKACVRCQMQRCRCVPGPGDECATCCKVDAKSKKIIHRLPCLRYRITDVVLSRPDAGEHGWLKLTKRWGPFQMHDIDSGDWDSDIIRTVKLTLDKCGTSSTVVLELEVRKFRPRPGDVLHRSWRDGHKLKQKSLEPYALASIRPYTQKFKAYINENALKAMSSYSLRINRSELHQDGGGEVPLVAKTYMCAVEHYHRLRVNDGRPESEQHEECQFMGALIKLWFAIRHTVGSSSLCGEDQLDMKPETTDHTYPLRARVSTPRMIIEQVDAINASIISGLRRAVLKVLERYFKNNRPAQWITLYLATFILLHEADVATEDRRRHGLANNSNPKEWYSLPLFVQELQKGANVLLAFWHYYRVADDPSEMSAGDWRSNTRMSSLTSGQFSFLQMSAEELKDKRAVYERGEDNLWEGPLYWVSQMFVKNWGPGEHFEA